jgi:rubrerythrin
MGSTQEDLGSAFAGESQASRRYLYFADKAEKEGQPQIARLFRAASEAETVHARNHLEVMGGIRATSENLEEAIEGEHYEFTEMYPGFIKQAESEDNKRARVSFKYANEVEKIHHGLYRKALGDLESGKQFKDEPYFVCQVCGNTVSKEAPERCPVCGAPRDKFKQVD